MDELNSIRILSFGLCHFENAFKDVELQITPEERDARLDSFTYSLKPVNLNSAEEYNKNKRALTEIKSYDADELSDVYKTRDFAVANTELQIGALLYLQDVLKNTNIINNMLSNICKEVKEINKNKEVAKESKAYIELKTRTSGCIDIIKTVRLNVKDLLLSKYCSDLERYYTDFENVSHFIFTNNAIPDEFAEDVNALYNGITLQKFSLLKANGKTRNECMDGFQALVEKLYELIYLFSEKLMEEFSVYFTSDKFLNNPKKKALFVVPMSMYVKFNFQRSGLYRCEIVSLKDPKDMEKTCKNYKGFYTELKKEMSSLLQKLKAFKQKETAEKDKRLIETMLENFEKCNKGLTEENIVIFSRVLKENLEFRERITRLVLDFKNELFESVKSGTDPWHNSEIYTEKKIDKDICIYIIKTYEMLDIDEKSLPQAQITRVLNMFAGMGAPEKKFQRTYQGYQSGKILWSDENAETFQTLLIA